MQITKGDNSNNFSAEGDININHNYGRIQKSKLAEIISSLIKDSVTSYFFDESMDNTLIDEVKKMEYNEIPIFKKRFINVVNPITLEKLESVFASMETVNIENQVICKVVNTFDSINICNKDTKDIKDKNYDLILIELHKKLMELLKNINLLENEFIEDTENTLDLLIYHVFRKCKILEKPIEES